MSVTSFEGLGPANDATAQHHHAGESFLQPQHHVSCILGSLRPTADKGTATSSKNLLLVVTSSHISSTEADAWRLQKPP